MKKCEYCNQEFMSESMYSIHKSTVHTEKIQEKREEPIFPPVSTALPEEKGSRVFPFLNIKFEKSLEDKDFKITLVLQVSKKEAKVIEYKFDEILKN